MVTVDDLQAVRADVLKNNPLSRSDAVFARKLFRKALRDLGVNYENAAFDRCFDSLTLRERRDEQPVRPAPVHEPVLPAPTPQPTPKEREAAFNAGKTKYQRAKEGIIAMRFPNGRDILNQTVGDVQSFGTWSGAILRALPKTAKATDKIGQYLSLDQLTKIRTFEV